jgi:thiaminase/transcriptional activator TenA
MNNRFTHLWHFARSYHHTKQTLTQRMLDEGQPTLQQILQLSFIEHLKTGTLPEEQFMLYKANDVIYLPYFSQGIEIIAGRITDQIEKNTLLSKALGAIQQEQNIRKDYLPNFKGDIHSTILSPNNKQYIEFLLSNAKNAPIETALAAHLPCFWVYQQLGEHLPLSQISLNHPFRPQIKSFSSVKLKESSNFILKMITTRANQLSQEREEKAIKTFKMGLVYERNFFPTNKMFLPKSFFNEMKQKTSPTIQSETSLIQPKKLFDNPTNHPRPPTP